MVFTNVQERSLDKVQWLRWMQAVRLRRWTSFRYLFVSDKGEGADLGENGWKVARVYFMERDSIHADGSFVLKRPQNVF
jgi:hypothetical protein